MATPEHAMLNLALPSGSKALNYYKRLTEEITLSLDILAFVSNTLLWRSHQHVGNWRARFLYPHQERS